MQGSDSIGSNRLDRWFWQRAARPDTLLNLCERLQEEFLRLPEKEKEELFQTLFDVYKKSSVKPKLDDNRFALLTSLRIELHRTTCLAITREDFLKNCIDDVYTLCFSEEELEAQGRISSPSGVDAQAVASIKEMREEAKEMLQTWENFEFSLSCKVFRDLIVEVDEGASAAQLTLFGAKVWATLLQCTVLHTTERPLKEVVAWINQRAPEVCARMLPLDRFDLLGTTMVEEMKRGRFYQGKRAKSDAKILESLQQLFRASNFEGNVSEVVDAGIGGGE
jgi:hypothetical protein